MAGLTRAEPGDFRDLFEGKAREIVEVYNGPDFRVSLAQLVHQQSDLDDLFDVLSVNRSGRERPISSPHWVERRTFERQPPPRIVDQYLAHGARGDRIEVPPISDLPATPVQVFANRSPPLTTPKTVKHPPGLHDALAAVPLLDVLGGERRQFGPPKRTVFYCTAI